MPMERDRYPANWEEISLAVREAAGWKCEKCGVANGALIVRSKTDKAHFLLVEERVYRFDDPTTGESYGLMDLPDEFAQEKFIRVVLTVHHVGAAKPDGTTGDADDKHDCRRENLLALCQLCHLRADAALHAAHARQTRHIQEVSSRDVALTRFGLEQLELPL